MRRILVLCLLIWSPIVLAAYQLHGVGAGKIADNLMEPVSILTNFIGSMSIVIGISCVFASFLKYLQYRVNPLVAPISTVLLLLLMGIILLLLPFAYKITEGGVPISL